MLDGISPLAAGTALRGGAAMVRAVGQQVRSFAEVFGEESAASPEAGGAPPDPVQAVGDFVRNWFEQRFPGANLDLSVRVQQGEIVGLEPSDPTGGRLLAELRGDPQLRSLLDGIRTMPGTVVVQASEPQSRLTATPNQGNIAVSAGGYPNW